jgi:hypothetical protein
MALSTEEANKINLVYQQLDAVTSKYQAALEDIHKLSNKISEYADALVTKCECKNHNSKKK